jgi:hypothetical protein
MNYSWSGTLDATLHACAAGVVLMIFAMPVTGQPANTSPGYMEKEVNVEAGEFEEPCFALAMTDRLEYTFSSDSPVEFNLHYHQDEGVYFPVEMKNVREHAGTFISTGSREYCLMWTNRGEGTLGLRYRYQLFRSKPAR